MNCETPGLGAHSSVLEYPITVDYGFIMDDVMQLRKLNRQSFDKFETLTYIQDPRVFPFDQAVLYKEGMKLTISVIVILLILISNFIPFNIVWVFCVF